MDERNEKTETLTASDAIPGAKFVDPRPSDLEVFYALLPGVLGSLAAKSTDSRSANAMALTMVREALGQCAALGILRVQTQCLDGQLLASLPQNVTPMGVQQPIHDISRERKAPWLRSTRTIRVKACRQRGPRRAASCSSTRITRHPRSRVACRAETRASSWPCSRMGRNLPSFRGKRPLRIMVGKRIG